MLFGDISDSIFCLQDSSYRSLELSIYRLSSVDVRLASVVYHQSSIYQLLFILHCHVYVGDWSTVAARWHRTCLVLRWGVVTSLLQFVTPADTLHRALIAGTGLLVTTWRRLSPIFVIIDERCDCCHACTSWTSVMSSLCYWFDQCSRPSELVWLS